MKNNYIFTEDGKFKPVKSIKQSLYFLTLMRGGIRYSRQCSTDEEDKMCDTANIEALSVAINNMKKMRETAEISSMDEAANDISVVKTDLMIFVRSLEDYIQALDIEKQDIIYGTSKPKDKETAFLQECYVALNQLSEKFNKL